MTPDLSYYWEVGRREYVVRGQQMGWRRGRVYIYVPAGLCNVPAGLCNIPAGL